MKVFLIVFFLIPLFIIPAFGQEVGFYHNEAYDFSFNIPMDWQGQENVQIPNGDLIQVLFFPSEFSSQLSDDMSNIGRLLLKYLLGTFSIDAPLIGVVFENIPESKLPRLNEQALEQYFLDKIRNDIPTPRIISSDAETTSWGWIVTTKTRVVQTDQQYLRQDTIFIFKDRETYDVAYLAKEDWDYDKYYPVYEMVKESLVIKGVVVPEFHEIAIMVLGSGIIGIIALSKKFKILNS